MESTDDKKKLSLIATAVTTFFCGCPSLCLMVFGVFFMIPDPEFGDIGASEAQAFGIGLICFGLVVAIIPLIVAGYTFSIWRKAKNEDEYATRGETLDNEIVEVEATESLDEKTVGVEDVSDDDEIPPAI